MKTDILLQKLASDVEEFGLHHPDGNSNWWPAYMHEIDSALAAVRIRDAAPAMLGALQRLAHPMADDTDLDHALRVIAIATGAQE